jgi:UDP-N-acetylglucosamine--N-acetylmuramyl-(pentapeptide) pyrophosphoryl-undecaprenol N-acetylglucosamine transferase
MVSPSRPIFLARSVPTTEDFYTPPGVAAAYGASAVVENSHELRLVITGGGTGGHVLPALAVIDELRGRGALADVIWIGSREGVERQAAEEAGIRFVAIPTGKLRRYLSLRNLTDSARVPFGVLAARRALAAFRPDVVLSTGGFVSVPAVVAARGIAPVLTHEQTAILGLANRINARFADVLAVSHPQTEQLAGRLHRQVVITGNPIRVGLTTGDRPRGLRRLGFDPAIPVLYVTGGARGASPINRRIAALLPDILDQTQIVHQTGPLTANADAVNLTELRETLPETLRRRYAVVEFLRDELPDIYAAADLVLGRAGAGTIAELAYVGLPAILVPLPSARGDEQALNARVLGDAGAAVVIPQPDATPERLREEISALLGDPERRRRMAIAARTVARPDAAARLADELLLLARRRGHVKKR